MQDFGQPPYGPLDDSLDDPLYDPLDPFNDPFEAMLNAAFGSEPSRDNPLAAMNLPGPRTGEGEGRDNLGNLLGDAEANIEGTPPIRLGPDSLGEALGRLEKAIENSPPIPPVLETDNLDTILTALEKNIENTLMPPEPKIEVELFEDPGWGYPTPSIDTPSPPLGIYDNPAIQSTRDGRPVGQRGGRIKNKLSTDGEVWCPIADDYIQKENCENCQYCEQDTDVCTYYGEEEPDTDSQDDETNENSDD